MEQPVLSLIRNSLKIFPVAKKSFDENICRILKRTAFQSAFYLDLSLVHVLLIKIDQCFLNGRYRSNHIVCDSNFLKTWNRKKTWAFNKNLIESLKRKIMVKPCCAWNNLSINFLIAKNILALDEHLYPWKDDMGQNILSLIHFFEYVFEYQKKSFWWKFV